MWETESNPNLKFLGLLWLPGALQCMFYDYFNGTTQRLFLLRCKFQTLEMHMILILAFHCQWASSRGKQKGELQRQKLQAVSSPLDLEKAFPSLCGDFDPTAMLHGRKTLLLAAAIILT